jgi:ribosomal protein L7/L12
MSELALGLSIVALLVALIALSVARGNARAASGPRPNVLSSLAIGGVDGETGPRAFSAFDGAAGDGAASAVLAALSAGKKIEAIKLYRQRTGVGLKEAKDAVEAMERGQQ